MIKLLKLLLGIVLLVVILAVGGGMLLSPKFTVQRSIEVNAPADKVYALVADPREWKRWSAWNQRDPAMQIEYSGPASGAGAVWAWKSTTQGDGRMTFTAAEPNQRLAYDLFFPDFGTTSSGELSLSPAGSGTKVTWVMNGDMGRNPLYRWIGLFADKMVGKDFGEGLANLKTLAEKS
jgi:uncharacterized protein YndB with AHSA1/START domain